MSNTAKYIVFDSGGLQALVNQTKANKTTAAENSTAVDGLTDDFQEMTEQLTNVLGEVETCLSELDATKADVATVNTALDGKVDKVDGKGLSTNDYTTTEKTKLGGIEAGANKYILPAATPSALGGVKSGGDVTINNDGVITVNDDSHNHTIANVDGLQTALDGKETSGAAATALTNAKTYTDTKISALINSAPTTLDTLGEIATAMEENADVVEALEAAVGTKANASDLTSHTNNKSNPHGVTLSQLGVTATAAELNYADGVTSNIQTQLNALAARITALENALAALNVGFVQSESDM